jgi:nucleoside-diphosphate-sugar epimerase
MKKFDNTSNGNLEDKVICITGANGFIGKNLILKLINSKCQIRVLTRKKNLQFEKGIEVFIGDLNDPNLSLKNFLKNCDILYHCAGEINDERKMSSLHINGTQKLIDNIDQKTKKRLHWIQLSSCGAYGPPDINDIECERVITETSNSNPSNEYERTKIKSDEVVIKSSSNKFFYTILRPTNVIGPGMTNQSVFKLIKLVNSGMFFYIGKKEAICTFVHVEDVVKALLLIPIEKNSLNETFNISYDCTWKNLIEEISLILKVRQPALRMPYLIVKFPYKIIKLIFGKYFKIPNIDTFVYHTKYSTKKIENYLNFKFNKKMPISIRELVIEKSKR